MAQEIEVREPEPAAGGEVPSLLTPAEVAAVFRVDPKTVTRWAKARKLTTARTLGGHRRYLTDEVRALFIGSLTAALGDRHGPLELEKAFGNALTAAKATAAEALALEAPRA